jgi:hypothetical protein
MQGAEVQICFLKTCGFHLDGLSLERWEWVTELAVETWKSLTDSWDPIQSEEPFLVELWQELLMMIYATVFLESVELKFHFLFHLEMSPSESEGKQKGRKTVKTGETDGRLPHDGVVQDHGEHECQHHTIHHQAQDCLLGQEALSNEHSQK